MKAVQGRQTPARRRDKWLKETRPPRKNTFQVAVVMWLSLKLGDEISKHSRGRGGGGKARLDENLGLGDA